jgi:hypothetical protein
LVRKAIPKHNVHAVGEKANGFSAFFSKKLPLRGNIGRFASRFAGGGYAASVASLTLGDKFYLPRDVQ